MIVLGIRTRALGVFLAVLSIAPCQNLKQDDEADKAWMLRGLASPPDAPNQHGFGEANRCEEMPHLTINARSEGLRLAPPPAAPQRIIVESNLSTVAHLTKRIKPIYPPQAKAGGIEGTVRFRAVIGKDGHLRNVELVSGHPALVDAARQAVQQWEYTTVIIDGRTIEATIMVDVPFNLQQ